MKFLISFLLFPLWVIADPGVPKEGTIQVTVNGETKTYSTAEYEVKKKKSKFAHHLDRLDTKKYFLKSNSISLFMGRGPISIGVVETDYQGSKDYYLNYGNIYGLGLSQRMSERWHLEMVGLTNDTLMSGFTFEFDLP